MKNLPCLTFFKDPRYLNIIWEFDKSGKLVRYIVDPGGSVEASPVCDESGDEVCYFSFYRNFAGRAWEYRDDA